MPDVHMGVLADAVRPRGMPTRGDDAWHADVDHGGEDDETWVQPTPLVGPHVGEEGSETLRRSWQPQAPAMTS